MSEEAQPIRCPICNQGMDNGVHGMKFCPGNKGRGMTLAVLAFNGDVVHELSRADLWRRAVGEMEKSHSVPRRNRRKFALALRDAIDEFLLEVARL